MPVFSGINLDSTFGVFQDVCEADTGGKFVALYQPQGTDNPRAVVVTVDAIGNLTQGTPLEIDAQSWGTSNNQRIFKCAADKFICAGFPSSGGAVNLALISISGTTLTLLHNAQLANAYPGDLAWDYANSRGVAYCRRNSIFLEAVGVISVTGSTITPGTMVTLPNQQAADSIQGSGWQRICIYDSSLDRYVAFFNGTVGGVKGIWGHTFQLDGSLAFQNNTTDVLIAQNGDVFSGILGVHATGSGRYVVVGKRFQDLYQRVAMAEWDGSNVAPLDVVDLPDDNFSGSIAAVGYNSANDDVYVAYSYEGDTITNQLHFGRINGDDLLLSMGADLTPGSSSTIVGGRFTRETLYGFTLMGTTGSSRPQVRSMRFEQAVYAILPAFQATGGDRAPVNVSLSLPSFQMYHGALLEMSLAGDMGPLDVVDFYVERPSLPALNGDLGPLDGFMYGGAVIDADLGPLDGYIDVDILNPMRLSGDLGPLDGQMLAQKTIRVQISGNLGPIVGDAYGGAVIEGSIGPIVGSMAVAVPSRAFITGDLAPLTGSMTIDVIRGGRIAGDLAPLTAANYVAFTVDMGALTGAMDIAVVEQVDNVAWVMNKAHAGVTRYPEYPFDFVLRWRGKQFLATTDGLYLFGASESNPSPINARFQLPASDYGEARYKRVPRAYLGGDVGGQMKIGVSYDDGDEYQSEIDGRAGVSYWRAKLPRGDRGHNVALSVENVNGSDFEINGLDALIHVTGRKVG